MFFSTITFVPKWDWSIVIFDRQHSGIRVMLVSETKLRSVSDFCIIWNSLNKTEIFLKFHFSFNESITTVFFCIWFLLVAKHLLISSLLYCDNRMEPIWLLCDLLYSHFFMVFENKFSVTIKVFELYDSKPVSSILNTASKNFWKSCVQILSYDSKSFSLSSFSSHNLISCCWVHSIWQLIPKSFHVLEF